MKNQQVAPPRSGSVTLLLASSMTCWLGLAGAAAPALASATPLAKDGIALGVQLYQQGHTLYALLVLLVATALFSATLVVAKKLAIDRKAMRDELIALTKSLKAPLLVIPAFSLAVGYLVGQFLLK